MMGGFALPASPMTPEVAEVVAIFVEADVAAIRKLHAQQPEEPFAFHLQLNGDEAIWINSYEEFEANLEKVRQFFAVMHQTTVFRIHAAGFRVVRNQAASLHSGS